MTMVRYCNSHSYCMYQGGKGGGAEGRGTEGKGEGLRGRGEGLRGRREAGGRD